jgi:hypothetical protein
MTFTNTKDDPIILDSSPTPSLPAPPAEARQPQRRRTTSSSSLYFPLLVELITESYKAKRRTKREPSPESIPVFESPSKSPSPKPSPTQKPFNPFDYIPRLSNLLLGLPVGSLSSSTASVPPTSTPPRHQKRPPIPYAITVARTHIAAAVKDAKKKKVRPNTSSKLISRRQEDPYPPLNPTPNPPPNPPL